ncbi:hypothetical protein [Nocardia sp. NPDC052316]
MTEAQVEEVWRRWRSGTRQRCVIYSNAVAGSGRFLATAVGSA